MYATTLTAVWIVRIFSRKLRSLWIWQGDFNRFLRIDPVVASRQLSQITLQAYGLSRRTGKQPLILVMANAIKNCSVDPMIEQFDACLSTCAANMLETSGNRSPSPNSLLSRGIDTFTGSASSSSKTSGKNYDNVEEDFHIPRQWEYTALGEDLLNSCHKGSYKGFKFKVMSYNVLAPRLAESHKNLYKDCKPRSVEWINRKNLFLQHVDEFEPEILCLQEVQDSEWRQFYCSNLQKRGYKGVYKKRTGSKEDGCSIFFKKALFTLQEEESVEFYQTSAPLLNRDNIALLVKLKHEKASGSKNSSLVICTTHLLFNRKRQDIRVAQTQFLLAEIDKFAFNGFDDSGLPIYHDVILTGDFNEAKRDPVVTLITQKVMQYSDGPFQMQQRKIGFLPEHFGVTDNCQYAQLCHRRSMRKFSSSEGPTAENFESNVKVSTASQFYKKNALPASFQNRQSFPPSQQFPYCTGALSHPFYFKDVYAPQLTRSDPKDDICSTFQGEWTCVDYIFYSMAWSNRQNRPVEGKLKLLRRLGLLTQDQCSQIGRIPNNYQSSDHYSLVAEFMIKTNY